MTSIWYHKHLYCQNQWMENLTLIFFLNFVSFEASTIVNPIDEGEGCSAGHWEDVIWQTNLPHIGLHEDLGQCIGSCEWVKLTLLNGHDDVFVRSTNAQMSSLNLIAQTYCHHWALI
jgi:hypothetical protein